MTRHRPFTRRQALQNQAFLAALEETGNPRLAASLLGVHRSTYMKRRSRCPVFAQRWDAMIAAAHARFHESGGPRSAEAGPARRRSAKLRTEGGELVVGRTRGGRLQLRRAPAGWMTKAGEQAFFSALSVTANVRLSAAAAGFSHTLFYTRRRSRRPFAREMRFALAMGYSQVEMASLAAAMPESHEDDCWRHNDPPPMPPMTPNQALQLLFLHEKSVRQGWERPHRRKRRGESSEIYSQRLALMWTAEKAREADEEALRRAARAEPPGDWDEEPVPGAPGPPPLPALDQVTGWSKADPAKAPHDPKLALFGGWRIGDWHKRERARRE